MRKKIKLTDKNFVFSNEEINITFAPLIYNCAYCSNNKPGIFRSLSQNLTEYIAYFDKPPDYKTYWINGLKILCSNCDKNFRKECQIEKERLLGTNWQKILSSVFGKCEKRDWQMARKAGDIVIERWAQKK